MIVDENPTVCSVIQVLFASEYKVIETENDH
jgi:hypothetical protein